MTPEANQTPFAPLWGLAGVVVAALLGVGAILFVVVRIWG